MLKSLRIWSVAAVAGLFVSNAHAGFLLEPYLGYHTGGYEQSGVADRDLSGVSFGARVGYQNVLGPMVGLDYMTGKWTDDDNPKNDVTPSRLSVFAGFEFPIMLRVYAAYSLSNQLKFSSSDFSNTLKGDGAIKLGVGFTALPLLSINLEYMQAGYDEHDGGTLEPEVKEHMYGITVSVPFDL